MLTVLRHPEKVPKFSDCVLATGRSAILHLINRYKPDIAFLPSYLPDGVLRPFRHAGIETVFYKLTEGIQADVSDLQSKIISRGDSARKLVVDISYFGWPTLSHIIRPIVNSCGGIVLLDCAHALGANMDDCDAVLFSSNKFDPVPDGAIMRAWRDVVDLEIKEPLPQLPERALLAYADHLSFNRVVAESIGETASKSLFDGTASYARYYDVIDEDMSPHAPSQAAISAMALCDTESQLERRGNLSSTYLFTLPPDVLWSHRHTQFAFPIRCHGKRQKIAASLFEDGVAAFFQSERWHCHDGVAQKFHDDHLLLPMGDDVTFEDIHKMAKVIGGFF